MRIGDSDDKVFKMGFPGQDVLQMIVMEYLKSAVDTA